MHQSNVQVTFEFNGHSKCVQVFYSKENYVQ